MKAHILTDNRTKKRGLLAEHGLCIFIEYQGKHILFDTGQSDVYCKNAMQMDLDLGRTDYIVLSHGHYDHCGGLAYFPHFDCKPKIYAHEDAFARRYALNPDGVTFREIGVPWSMEQYEYIKSNIIFTKKNKQIASDVYLYGEIPSTSTFEGIPSGFYCGEEDNKSIDMFKDEQVLVFDTEKGLSIFLGCSHPGVVNCLRYVTKQFHGKQIYSLVAGMHLNDVAPLRLQMTIQHIIDLNIKQVIPLHCTGIFAISEIKRFLGERCLVLCAGDSVTL